MNLRFVEVWERGAFGNRDRRLINPNQVVEIRASGDSPDECCLEFTTGKYMSVEGAPNKMASLFASETSDPL